jgi:hypothetical protein
MDLHIKYVKINPLIDTGDGRRYCEVIQLGDMVAKYGLQGARANLAELRAEATARYESRQLRAKPTPRKVTPVARPRARATRSPKTRVSSPTATRRSRSKCHGRSADPEGGDPRSAREQLAQCHPTAFLNGYRAGFTGQGAYPSVYVLELAICEAQRLVCGLGVRGSRRGLFDRHHWENQGRSKGRGA